jgi:hypothetical protein
MKIIKMFIRYLVSILPITPQNIIYAHKIPIAIYLYIKNYIFYSRQNSSNLFKINLLDSNPNLFDRFEDGGSLPKHYFHQDLWMAQKIHQKNPINHYDIGSKLDGFISHCLVFTNVVMLDIRDIKHDIKGLDFVQTNAMNMKNISTSSIESISSLHAIEHFGLGRYGDPIDLDGYMKAIMEIQRVAKKDIYFSVPIGVQKLIFDSHRIFDPLYIVELFDKCDLEDFAAIDDDNNLHTDIQPADCRKYNYGCGLYHFKKGINV